MLGQSTAIRAGQEVRFDYENGGLRGLHRPWPPMDEFEPDPEGPPYHDRWPNTLPPLSPDAVSVVSSTPVALGPDPLGDGATLSELEEYSEWRSDRAADHQPDRGLRLLATVGPPQNRALAPFLVRF